MESEDHQTWSHLRNYSEVTPLRHLVYQGVQPNTMHKEEIRCPKRIPRQNPCVPTTPIGIHAHTIRSNMDTANTALPLNVTWQTGIRTRRTRPLTTHRHRSAARSAFRAKIRACQQHPLAFTHTQSRIPCAPPPCYFDRLAFCLSTADGCPKQAVLTGPTPRRACMPRR